MQHCRFPPPLMPRVVAFHADRAEPDANALVWVKKKTSQKRHKEDSYLKVVQGHIYQSDFFFFSLFLIFLTHVLIVMVV